MNNNEIFIFSQGRSGGSTLNFAINCLVEGVLEAESLSNHCPEVDQKLKDKYDVHENNILHLEYQKEYKNILEGYLEDSEGLKHNITNFDYFDSERWFVLDKMLFDYFDKVIVNDRKNWLKWGVSFQIADKLSYYGIDNEEQQEEYNRLVEETEPFDIDIDFLDEYIKTYKGEWNRRINYIENNDIDYMYFTYENVYDNPKEYRLRHFETLARFLGFEDFEVDSSGIEHLFSDIRKVSGKNRNYQLVKNLDEINEKLGSKYGYLY